MERTLSGVVCALRARELHGGRGGTWWVGDAMEHGRLRVEEDAGKLMTRRCQSCQAVRRIINRPTALQCQSVVSLGKAAKHLGRRVLHSQRS